MRMIEWAFEQDIPHASKLVLVYLAANASAEGVGRMDRATLMKATGYKVRSVQRILQALRNNELLTDIGGPWYRVGTVAPDLLANEIGELPEPLGEHEAWTKAYSAAQARNHAEELAQTVGDYVIDQFANFETRIMQHIDRLAVFHVEQELEVPPDPVIDNPLYEQLIDSGMAGARAYALSQADLEMGEELDNEAPSVTSDEYIDADGYVDEYPDDRPGRLARIADILHGSDAAEFHDVSTAAMWEELEVAENKHTVKGEQDAFLLLYPQIVAAAKANVGKLSLSEFCNVKAAAHYEAPWHRELSPPDKDDPAFEVEIEVMLAELEATGNQQCQVQPRTTETADDGSIVQETLLGFHRRVKAKHNQMLHLKEMEII